MRAPAHLAETVYTINRVALVAVHFGGETRLLILDDFLHRDQFQRLNPALPPQILPDD